MYSYTSVFYASPSVSSWTEPLPDPDIVLNGGEPLYILEFADTSFEKVQIS
jgi:hypothetical protein